MGNKRKHFGNCGMVYTIVYQEYNGQTTSALVYGPLDQKKMMTLALKEYKRLLCLIKGNQQVFFPPNNS
jgi:hypothetical protein